MIEGHTIFQILYPDQSQPAIPAFEDLIETDSDKPQYLLIRTIEVDQERELSALSQSRPHLEADIAGWLYSHQDLRRIHGRTYHPDRTTFYLDMVAVRKHAETVPGLTNSVTRFTALDLQDFAELSIRKDIRYLEIRIKGRVLNSIFSTPLV